MKVRIDSKNDVSIFFLEGKLDRHHLAVLKAGLTKFFRDGGDVVLNFTGTHEIDVDVFEELAGLHIFAKNQGCGLVLSCVPHVFRDEVLNVSVPRGLRVFNNDSAAAKYLANLSSSKEDPFAEAPEEWRQKLTEQRDEIEELRAKLNKATPGIQFKREVGDAALTAKNRMLERQLRLFLEDRRIPPDGAVMDEKISILEETIQELMNRPEPRDILV